MTPVEIDLPTRRATTHLARDLASVLHGGDLVVLSGALGAGKTFLVRALCRALGHPQTEPVTSPTFALMQEIGTDPPVIHADLYRLDAPEQTRPLGLAEGRDDGALLLVEWGERFIDELGGDALVVELLLSPRRARVSATGERAARVLASLSRRDPT